jgi:hypothetical protein
VADHATREFVRSTEHLSQLVDTSQPLLDVVPTESGWGCCRRNHNEFPVEKVNMSS